MSGALFEIRGATKRFRLPRTSLLSAPRELTAVNGVTFDVNEGETFGIVG